MEIRYRRLVTIAGVVLLCLTGVMARLGDFSGRISLFLVVFAAAFVVYAAAAFMFSRLHSPYRRSVALIFIVAVGCRLVLLGSQPSLSNDVYRYLWEGRVIAAGHNPFAVPPDAAKLEELRDANYDNINHPHLETIYPPLAQGVFLLGAVISPTVTMQKLLFMLFDLGALAILALWLRRRGRNPNLCVIYGWSPLVVVEFAHSGHMDAIGIFFLLLALYLFERSSAAKGMVAMALSFLAKMMPLMLAPYFLLRKRLAIWIPLGIAVVVAGYLPFAGAGTGLWSSLGVYGRHWQFNSPVYRILERVWNDPEAVRSLLAGVIVVFAFYQARRERDIAAFAFRVVACAILLSPTVYPWYVTWIVPFLCFYSSRAWLYFTGAVMLSYVVWVGFPETGVWRLNDGFLAAEYAPFYAMLLYELFGRRRSSAA